MPNIPNSPVQGPSQSLTIVLPTDKTRSKGLTAWMNAVSTVATTHAQYGETPQRPSSGLYTGQPFYDTTIQSPVNWNGNAWIAPANAAIYTPNGFVYGNSNKGLSTTAAPTNGQLLIGSTGSTPVVSTLTAGPGINITDGTGSITINNTGVLSVGLVDNSTSSIYTITNSPITTAGNLTITLKTQTANTAFMGPTTGSAAQPAIRAIAKADLSTVAVTTLQGTSNQIDVSASVGTSTISIDSGYVGQTSITTLGTVTTGTWNATAIANAHLANSSLTVTAGTGLSGGGSVSLGSSVTLTNAGVTSNVAGTGISVSGATGAVTIANTGGTSVVAGSRISVSGATGAVTVTAAIQAPSYQIITATAAQTVFTTTVNTVTNKLMVFNLRTKQIEGTDYTVTGANQVTFTVGVTLANLVEFYSFA